MKDDKNISIKINIGGTKLPLNIAREDEELYRKAERLLVKNLEDFLRRYQHKSMEEILTYVAYQIAVNALKQDSSEDIEPLAEKIQSLDDELKALLTVD